VQGLYPYIGPFDTLYRIRFPRWRSDQPLADLSFTLGIAGAVGRIELTWEAR
jgi:hypothetical protein